MKRTGLICNVLVIWLMFNVLKCGVPWLPLSTKLTWIPNQTSSSSPLFHFWLFEASVLHVFSDSWCRLLSLIVFSRQKLLYVMNPTKYRNCEYLIKLHEARGDKVMVFSDNVFALNAYADAMHKPKIFGQTGDEERERLLAAFRNPDSRLNCLFISKVLAVSLSALLFIIHSHVSSWSGWRLFDRSAWCERHYSDLLTLCLSKTRSAATWSAEFISIFLSYLFRFLSSLIF